MAVFIYHAHRIIMRCQFNVKQTTHSGNLVALEDRTARLTILIDPRKKAVFERLCAEEDATPSQVVRRLIRTYIEERQGKPWRPEEIALPPGRRAARRR
jgi:Ribbon-helix-helix protein